MGTTTTSSHSNWRQLRKTQPPPCPSQGGREARGEATLLGHQEWAVLGKDSGLSCRDLCCPQSSAQLCPFHLESGNPTPLLRPSGPVLDPSIPGPRSQSSSSCREATKMTVSDVLARPRAAQHLPQADHVLLRTCNSGETTQEHAGKRETEPRPHGQFLY